MCVWAWDGAHNMAYGLALDGLVGPRRMSGSLRGVNVTPGPIWMAHEWPMSAGARV
jgi:hypothetical protein